MKKLSSIVFSLIISMPLYAMNQKQKDIVKITPESSEFDQELLSAYLMNHGAKVEGVLMASMVDWEIPKKEYEQLAIALRNTKETKELSDIKADDKN